MKLLMQRDRADREREMENWRAALICSRAVSFNSLKESGSSISMINREQHTGKGPFAGDDRRQVEGPYIPDASMRRDRDRDVCTASAPVENQSSCEASDN